MKTAAYVSVVVACFIAFIWVGSLIGETSTGQVTDAIQAVAAVVVAIAALRAADAYRKETRFRNNADAAKDVVFHVREFDRLFHQIRTRRFQMSSGDLNFEIDTSSNDPAVRQHRDNLVAELKRNSELLVVAILKIDLWSEGFCSAEITRIVGAEFHLTMAYRGYHQLLDNPQTAQRDILESLERTVFGSEDDELGTIVTKDAEAIQRKCRKLIS